MQIFISTLFILNLISQLCFADELKISILNKSKILTKKNLLNHKDLEEIVVVKDPVYGDQLMKYKAVSISNLLKNEKIDDDAVIKFKTKNGFIVPLLKQRLEDTAHSTSEAFLAIEEDKNKWPVIGTSSMTAGPFYLVWKKPELSNIKQAEWLAQIVGIESNSTVKELYPEVYPANKLPNHSSIKKGFKTFLKNCFACHTMNGQGASQFGPDLNKPLNPVEYFKPSALKALIRNPDTVRAWDGRRMPSFSEDLISQKEMDSLIAYFQHMAKVRKQ